MTQIRVHELASELDVSPQQILLSLEELGQKVRGPSTVLGVSAAARVRRLFRSVKSTTDTGEAEVEVPDEGQVPVSAPKGQMTAADQAGSLFLPPVAPAVVASAPRTTGAFANPFSVPAANPIADRAAPRPPVPVSTPHAVANRVGPVPPVPLVIEPEPDNNLLWERRGISRRVQELWMANGLRSGEAELADRCQSAGIAPEELTVKLSGRTTLQRLRDGEAVTSVWARIREAEQQPRRAGTKLTGRFQLS